MEKFEVQSNLTLDLTTIEVVLPITLADLAALIVEKLAGSSPSHVIWHFRPGVLELLDTTDLKMFLNNRESAAGNRRDGHTVFVAHDEMERLYVKWYKKFCEADGDNQIQYHISESLEAAMELVEKVVSRRYL